MLKTSYHQIWFICKLSLFPLFEFYNNQVSTTVLVITSNYKIYTFGCEGNLIFNSYSSIFGQLWSIHNPIHVLHGILP